ncbi:uncharacterized protein LOC128242913 isoform X3 [Mya arenaria]|uniref:uncharacterized protein LOC128242913 isoform X3 n=1 Tax=Mya arenaria TaxID=6604 RepID=UPI0022E85385|nr:uncharacterized protein LOC128242913 isoform X3 [Mya arenaria]
MVMPIFSAVSYMPNICTPGKHINGMHIWPWVPDLSTVTWKNEADIHVRAQQDKATCYISGLALLSPGLFLLADFDNYCANWWTSTPAPSRSSSSCQTSPGTYVCFLMTRQQLLSRIRP